MTANDKHRGKRNLIIKLFKKFIAKAYVYRKTLIVKNQF